MFFWSLSSQVNKVTLIPRGQAKGLTWFTPGEDQSLISAAMLKAPLKKWASKTGFLDDVGDFF